MARRRPPTSRAPGAVAGRDICARSTRRRGDPRCRPCTPSPRRAPPLHAARPPLGRPGDVPVLLGLSVTGAAFVVVTTPALQAVIDRLDPRAAPKGIGAWS